MADLSNDRALWITRNVLPHEPALRAYLGRWRLPPDLDRDDVVQEAYGRFASFETVAKIQNPRAYLFSVARTIVLMHIRRARIISILAIEEFDPGMLSSDEPSPETHVSDREQLHLLATAVSNLPEPSRQAFLLRVGEEMSHRDIGERLGMSDNAVQKSIAKSLLLLMARIGRGGNDLNGASIDRRQQQVHSLNDATREERSH